MSGWNIIVIRNGKSLKKSFRNEDYLDETARRIEEKLVDHNKRDKNLHLLRHSRKKNHQRMWESDFKVLGNNYCLNFKRKITEVLFTKQLKQSLNVKDKSAQLQLYHWFTILVESTCLKLTKVHTRATQFTLFLSLYCQVWASKYVLEYKISDLLKVYIKNNIWIENCSFKVLCINF